MPTQSQSWLPPGSLSSHPLQVFHPQLSVYALALGAASAAAIASAASDTTATRENRRKRANKASSPHVEISSLDLGVTRSSVNPYRSAKPGSVTSAIHMRASS